MTDGTTFSDFGWTDPANGSTLTRPFGINDQGAIIGDFYFSGEFTYRGVLDTGAGLQAYSYAASRWVTMPTMSTAGLMASSSRAVSSHR